MARTYNQQNPDGSWSQVTQNDNGTYTTVPIAPSGYAAANIPTGSTGAQTYNTPNGSRTLDQMRSELAAAGYNGAQDDASVIAAYNQTALGTSSSTDLTSSAQKMLDAIASGDQQKFDESVREFNANLAEQQRQFNATNALAQTTQYGNLASNLLSTAAGLRGPQDYYQYQKYLSGGKDLINTLYGSTPLPSFNAPYGTNTPVSLSGLMQSLGLLPATSTTPATTTDTTTAATTSPVSGTVAAVGASTTPTTTGPTQQSTTPGVGMEPATGAPASPTGLPVSGTATGQAGTGTMPSNTTPPAPTQAAILAGFTDPSQIAPAGQSDTGTTPSPTLGPGGAPQTPSPYQINPQVWDSIGPVGQALTLSAYTANGGDANEFLRQLNNSRLPGAAPTSTTTSFKSSSGMF